MKLANIARITKKHEHLRVFGTSQTQWVSIGAAAYPLYGMPQIRNKEEMLALLDVPEEKREPYEVIFENPEDLARFDDCTEDDTPLADKGITFAQRGSYLRPLFAEDGRVYWINECYIAPVEDEKDLAYFLRELEDGIFAVAVIAGLEIVALIGVRIAAPETEESLLDIFRGCKDAEQAGYRIPKEMVIAYGGYQIPVTGFIGGDVREWEERGEQEKIV